MENSIRNRFQEILDQHGIEQMVYAFEFEQQLAKLEAQLHSVENPEEIARGALIAAVEFYDGDWCGIIEGDLDMEAWCPVLWYDRKTKGMTATKFHELEDTNCMEQWIDALYACKPVIIPDTTIYRESNPVEYELYHRCNADSILAVPFWQNPTGFMIVRNPKRFIEKSSYLQMAAYVVFSSVTEKKLLERTNKAYSPEKIKKDTDVIINIFGDLEIYTSKGYLTEEMINSPKFCHILVYFLTHSRRPMPPKAIWEAIWPEENSDNAGSNMRSLFVRFKDAFSIISDHRLIVSTSKGYQLNPELNIMTDVGMFDEYWVQSQNGMTLNTRIEFMRRAVDLYKGDVFSSASSEPWLLNYALVYKYKCLGIYNELMKIHFESGNYVSVHHYAEKALEIEEANIDSYYWMIRALRKKNSNAMARGQLIMAENVLTEEEYNELVLKLEKADDSSKLLLLMS